MASESATILVIGVSSRALFHLEAENEVFEQEGVDGYRRYQEQHEQETLQPGAAFPLIQRLLQLNEQAGENLVEVVVMSRNSPETGMRVLHSIREHQLPMSRMAFTGGAPLGPYIEAFELDLFLSKDAGDVQTAIDSQSCAAAYIYAPPAVLRAQDQTVRIAFDADAVLFSEESELRYKSEGIAAFHQYERDHETVPLAEGPFAKLLLKLAALQRYLTSMPAEHYSLRIAIVTARSAPAHIRVINTLRHWGVQVDEVYFMGGRSKDKVLRAFGAHIYFDDQDIYLKDTSKSVPSGRVPYSSDSQLNRFNKK